MFRKVCTTAVVTAALAAGSLGLAGTANAAVPTYRHIGNGSGGLGSIVCGVVSGIGGNDCGAFRGHNFGNHFRGGRWDGGSTIILNGASYGVSDCGCGDNTVLLDPVTTVQRRTVVEEVPVGSVGAGDGSCATFLNRGFSYFGSNRRVHWHF